MRTIHCHVARVFTRNGKSGNKLGVVTETAGLAAADMQAIAARLGFSETSFVFFDTKKGDYRVRFFTPEKEIPFAGHPTIGTLFVLRALGLVKKGKAFVQVIGPRRVPLEVAADGVIWMEQGKPSFASGCARGIAASLLGAHEGEVANEPMAVSTGLPIMLIHLQNRRALTRARILNAVYQSVFKKHGTACIMPFAIDKGQVYSRMFAPNLGIAEDPATGSAAGPLAAYLTHMARVAPNEKELRLDILQRGGAKSLLYARVALRRGEPAAVSVGGRCVMAGPRTVRL